MKRDILLIEGDDRQRVGLSQALLAASWRVTIASSLEEAAEILRHVDCAEAGPGIVLFGGKAAGLAGARYERALIKRFAGIRVIRLPQACTPARLVALLGSGGPAPSAPRRGPELRPAAPAVESRRMSRILSVILIEADRARRVAIEDHMRLRGDDVVGCRSVDEATVALDNLLAQGAPVDAVLSAPEVLDAAGLRFCAAATRRVPELRWIFVKEPTPVAESLAI